MNDCERISEELYRHHDGKFGFVIYRIAYGDDAAWERFITRLTAHVHIQLDDDPKGHLIKDHFTWEIMDNKEELEGATKAQVREKLKQWSDMVDGLPIHARYVNPIYADQEVIESVLNGDEPTSMTSADRNRPRAFVKVLDDQFEDEPEESDVGEESEDEDEKTAEPGSEGYPPIEGCTRQDVGWTKIAARNLIPRAYSMLLDNGWPLVYARPSAIMSD